MKFSSLALVAVACSPLMYVPAGAGANGSLETFSGIVSRVSPKYITVKDAASNRSLEFRIVPTHGYGVLSPDGQTTYQMSAIKVGWHIKVDYDRSVTGKRHADHIVLLR